MRCPGYGPSHDNAGPRYGEVIATLGFEHNLCTELGRQLVRICTGGDHKIVDRHLAAPGQSDRADSPTLADKVLDVILQDFAALTRHVLGDGAHDLVRIGDMIPTAVKAAAMEVSGDIRLKLIDFAGSQLARGKTVSGLDSAARLVCAPLSLRIEQLDPVDDPQHVARTGIGEKVTMV